MTRVEQVIKEAKDVAVESGFDPKDRSGIEAFCTGYLAAWVVILKTQLEVRDKDLPSMLKKHAD